MVYIKPLVCSCSLKDVQNLKLSFVTRWSSETDNGAMNLNEDLKPCLFFYSFEAQLIECIFYSETVWKMQYALQYLNRIYQFDNFD